MQNVFLQSTVYSLQSTVYSLQSTVYSLQSTVYSLQSVRLPTVDCLTADYIFNLIYRIHKYILQPKSNSPAHLFSVFRIDFHFVDINILLSTLHFRFYFF